MDLPDIKRSWLREHFSRAVYDHSRVGVVRATIPGLYQITKPQQGIESFLHGRVLNRHLGCLKIPDGLGETRQESLSSLFYTVARGVAFGADICGFAPKPGQAESMLKIGSNYEIVHREDRAHDHESIELLDFTVYGLTEKGGIGLLEFDDTHIHLKKLSFF